MTDQNEYRNIVVASNVVQYTAQFIRQLDSEFNRDAGYFFAPYVPLTQTPTVLDADSFRRPEGVAGYSREALDQGQRYYGRITIDQFGIRDEPNIYHDDYEYIPRPREKVNWLKEGF